jgi:hypothetical protein
MFSGPTAINGKSQVQNLIAHLKNVGPISPVEAKEIYGITRLASRINDLKNKGLVIERDIRTDALGKRYARYWLSA